MKQDIKTTRLTTQDMVRIELRNIDYTVDTHLKEYKDAIEDHDEDRLTHLDEQLTALVVERHYLDPTRKIENHY